MLRCTRQFEVAVTARLYTGTARVNFSVATLRRANLNGVRARAAQLSMTLFNITKHGHM